MPTLIPYTLAFRSGLHLGTRGVNLEEAGASLPADTLFGALLHAWRRLGWDVEALAAPFVAAPPKPPFLLTSAFPYAGGVRFYPMPVDLGRLFGPHALKAQPKTVKRVRYLSEGLLRRALAGEKLDGALYGDDPYEAPAAGIALQGGALWLLREEVEGLPQEMRRSADRLHALRSLAVYDTGRVPRVTIDRVSSGSNIFHAGQVRFAAGCGLWFGVAWRTPPASPYREALALGLAMLKDEGIGGERTVGYGTFAVNDGPSIVLPDPKPGNPAWLLSRYHPRADELPAALIAPDAAYRLTAVGGWLHSPSEVSQRRKRLTLLAEGSVICPTADPAGDVRDVRPEYDSGPGTAHPVYRYGLALAAGWA